MADVPQTHFADAEFDLDLRPRSRWAERAAIARQVRELPAQALLGADEGDAALIRAEVAEDFLVHLAVAAIGAELSTIECRLAPQEN